ncbi:MAG: ferritin family protein [Bacillota bacterium]|nr:ferritin family protein [Bacillota bacterium]
MQQGTVSELDLAKEVKLGVARHTALEQPVDDSYKGEAVEAAHYLACARQAQREGYPEIGLVLERLGLEELEHAIRFAELNARVDDSTLANLARLLKEEQASCRHKAQLAQHAGDERLEEVRAFYAESSRDEARHARALDGLLRRYFQ